MSDAMKKRLLASEDHKRANVDITPSGWANFFHTVSRQFDRQLVMLFMNGFILVASLWLIWFIFDMKSEMIRQNALLKRQAEGGD